MVIALAGIVCADQVVPAVPETQALSTVTTADVVGLAMETDVGTWTTTNSGGISDIITSGGGTAYGASFVSPGSPAEQQLIAGGGNIIFSQPTPYISQITIPESMLNTVIAGISSGLTWGEFENILLGFQYTLTKTKGGIHDGALNPGQIQYTTTYDANIVAQGGHTSFVKNMNIDTRNKVIGQSNVNAKTRLSFAATSDGGNVVGSENLMIDGAGNTTTAADKMLCPFASAGENVIPAYCNIVQAGSKYDLTVGSVTTNANDRFVGTDATNPVVLNYDISVKPYMASGTQVPASGSTMAYLKVHIQEARGWNNTTIPTTIEGITLPVPGAPVKAEDLTYSETSSAQGTITAFTKVIAYQSGKALL